MHTLTHFDQLVDLGLQVIPLWENSKRPMFKRWTIWDYEKSRETIRRYPDANLGLLLGDVIDVEGDSESANTLLLDLIGDYPHPCYRSTKSLHHLFRSPDKKLRIFKHNDIEFRGYRHQSVLPPSHHQGVCYEWVQPCDIQIPEMPQRLLRFYHQTRYKQCLIKPGDMKVRCANCERYTFIHKRRFTVELAASKRLSQPWKCRKCRTVDLRPLCKR